MRLFDYDAYASLTRFIDRAEPLVLIDVGANEGLTAKRMLDEFPSSRVFAFEPAPETFQLLRARADADPRISPFPLACGSRTGSIDFHVTKNNWCSSVLPPTDLGKRYYGDWYDTRQVVTVPVTTLDEWAAKTHVPRVDFMKIDAQGYDLEVLKGAEHLLRSGLRAINCECQFAPEYEGCATFSQVDQFLSSRGFQLHQLHEVWSKGDEQQTSYADALWLRADILAALRQRKDLPDLSPKGRVTRALLAASRRGRTRAALFGGGQHTRRLAPHLAAMPLPVVAIIDDNPALAGTTLDGRPVITQHQAGAMGIDIVVLSSDAHEAALWASSSPLRQRGIDVIPIYGAYADTTASSTAA